MGKYYIHLKMSNFRAVIIDGCGMVPNKEVYLSNHCIDGSRTLHLVWNVQDKAHKVSSKLMMMRWVTLIKIRPLDME